MKFKHNVILVLTLSILSAVIYAVQLEIFNRPDDTFFYFLQDLASVPIQAIIVTLILNSLLKRMERQQKLKKEKVVISAFFSESGKLIFRALSNHNDKHHELYDLVKVTEFDRIKLVRKKVKEFDHEINVTRENLEELKSILVDKRSSMIGMLQNSNLLEHDSFTNMLWAVFHVADELQHRESLDNLPREDLDHLSKDILRAYTMIVLEWIDYIRYLKEDYPYLYNLELRKDQAEREKAGMIK